MIIRLDYATLNFSAGSMSKEKVPVALLGEDHNFCWSQKGNSGNLFVSPYGLSWLDNSGFAPRPHRLQISGRGCEDFFWTLPQLVTACDKNGGECSFSRLDFAFDTLVSVSEWRNYLCSVFSASLNSERKLKKFTLSGSGEAMTIYIGSRKCGKFFRIYNKSLEDKSYIFRDDDGNPVDFDRDNFYVIRYEVELKRFIYRNDGVSVLFDPSPYFFQFYSSDYSLVDTIRQLWLSFGNEILLPDDFEHQNLQLLSKTKNFASIPLQVCEDYSIKNAFQSPYSFEKVSLYVVDHYAKYIPFIIANPAYWRECVDKCKNFIGFVPDLDLDQFIFPLDEKEDLYNDELPWDDEIMTYDALSIPFETI